MSMTIDCKKATHQFATAWQDRILFFTRISGDSAQRVSVRLTVPKTSPIA